MIFKEFGNKNKPVLMMIHGEGLSWWNYKKEIKLLKINFHIITPIIDGHGDDYKTEFTSISDVSSKIINYIKTKFNGKIFALCGLSLGGQIVVDILSKEHCITEYAVIESALISRSKFIVHLIIPIYNFYFKFSKYKWFSFIQSQSLNISSDLFDDYYNDSKKISHKTLINITKCNESYRLPDSLNYCKSKVLILVGEKEISTMKKSAIILNVNIPDSVIEIVEGSSHGELSLNYPEKYVKLLTNFLNTKKD